jgi:colanic acid biosynthesis glycosyl transferase WcaI
VKSLNSSSRTRVLIFGINYAPEAISTGVNTTGLAEALPELGWDVTVVTGIPHYPAWQAMPIPSDISYGAVEVIRRRHYIPSRQSLLRRGAFELSWVLSSLPVLRAMPKPDLVLGVVPNLGGAALAAAAATRYRVPYALMFQDLIGRAATQSGVSGASRAAGALRRIELSLARRAAVTAVIAEGFRDYFIEGGVPAQQIARIRNPVRLFAGVKDRAETRARLGWGEGEFIVLHSGNMGYKQGLENVIDAAALAREQCSLRFILQGDGNQRQELEARARGLGLTNLSFLPLAPAEAFPSILAAADLLLVNQRAAVRDMSLPAKITSYFAVGVATLAAVAPESETGKEVVLAGAGEVVRPEDPAALLQAISGLADDPARRAQYGAAGRRYAEHTLSAGEAMANISRVLRSVLATPESSPKGGAASLASLGRS